MDSDFPDFLSNISPITSQILIWLGGLVLFFVVEQITHFIKKRRGNPDRYWEKYLAAKMAAEEGRLKDPSLRAQIVWDQQEEKQKESQRQMVREVITASGRYKYQTPMTEAEIIRKIQNEQWPFEKWMMDEYLDGSLVGESLTAVQRMNNKIRRWVEGFIEQMLS